MSIRKSDKFLKFASSKNERRKRIKLETMETGIRPEELSSEPTKSALLLVCFDVSVRKLALRKMLKMKRKSVGRIERETERKESEKKDVYVLCLYVCMTLFPKTFISHFCGQKFHMAAPVILSTVRVDERHANANKFS